MNKIGPREYIIPEGDNRERLSCPDCGYIEYSNPKTVVGALCTWENKILLCKRAIEPRKGFWTLPAGFMENKETTQDGAKRETYEEACAQIDIEYMLSIYELPHLSQIQIFYKASLISPDIAVGEESLDVALYEWSDIPWPDLAFPTVKLTLDHYRKSQEQANAAALQAPDYQIIDKSGIIKDE